MLLKNFINMYIEGFKNLKIGKTLWKLIFIKLLIILVFLKYFIYDENFKNTYKTQETKIDFVYKNITKDK